MTGVRFDADLALEALARSPLFQGILPEDLQRLARGMARRRYRRHDVIFHEGDPGDRTPEEYRAEFRNVTGRSVIAAYDNGDED